MKVFEGTPEEYYMDGYLNSNLQIAVGAIKKDFDMIFAVDGPEGSGKSVIAQQVAKFVDPTFCIERIVFTPPAFKKAVVEAKKYQAIIFDEAYTGLNSRGAMSIVNRSLISMIAEIRQKNLFILVVCPSFFDLDRYVALHRSRALVHVYMGENFERGYFAFYNLDRKKDLYINGKKFYSYGRPKPNFIGRFTNHYVVDEQKYRQMKKTSLTDRELKREEEEKRKELYNLLFEKLMGVEDIITHEVKAKILGIPLSTYYFQLRKWNERGEIAAI